MNAQTFDDPRLILALVTILWTAIGALARRAVILVEKKIDKNAQTVDTLKTQMADMIGDSKYRTERNFREIANETRGELKELSALIDATTKERRQEVERLNHEQDEKLREAERRMDDRTEDIRRQSVTRHEFHLLIANVDTKLEAIYEKVATSKRKPKNRDQ